MGRYIATAFNATMDKQPRTAKSLRLKYESLKKEVRKASAQKRKDWEDTGGGPYKPTMWPPIYEKLYANIKMSCDGMNSPFDCDSKASTMSLGEIVESHILEETVDDPGYQDEMCLQNESITVDFADYSAPMLQTKKPKELKYSEKTPSKFATVKDGTPTYSDNIKVIKIKSLPSKPSEIYSVLFLPDNLTESLTAE